jgi:hypothetical protein
VTLGGTRIVNNDVFFVRHFDFIGNLALLLTIMRSRRLMSAKDTNTLMVRWNITRHLKKYANADVLVLSVGKSGRTWLRVLLNKFLSLHFNVPFTVEDLSKANALIPSILYEHEAWSHFSDATLFKQLVGRNIVPEHILRRKKVVLLYRDPRDVLVSLYFQKTKRSRRKIDCTLADFVKDRRHGIENIIRVMNLWHHRLKDHPRCLWISYETLKRDPRGELERLLSFLDIGNCSVTHLHEAVNFADFENMKSMERSNEFGNTILSARDASDPGSYKVREGKAGGYVKYFDAVELGYLDEKVALLDPFYGYEATPPQPAQ